MANYLDKTSVNTAIVDNTKLDLGHQHISTMDFMQLNLSMIQELVPGSKIDVKMESFARLNPLVVPTFGRASIRNRAFFVPFRVLMGADKWNDFITDAPHVASTGYNAGQTATLVDLVPVVSTEDLVFAFTNYIGTSATDGAGMIYQVSPNQQNTNWDLVLTNSGVTSYYCYTVKGRQCLKLLEQLGYKLDYQNKGKNYVSALPLLALARIYVDWYYPQQYSNRTEYDFLLSLCKMDSGNLVLNASQVATILQLCAWVQYDSDLFVSAWDTPNQPNSGNLSTDFKLVNIDTAKQLFVTGSGPNNNLKPAYVTNNAGTAISTNRVGFADAPFITPYTDNGGSYFNSPISEYLLHGLHALTDYMKRHQLAGTRAFERYLARFGMAIPSEKLNRSRYLGVAIQNVQIGDIMSTADTSGAQLGMFAGKGLSYGNGHFDFATDEYGYFIVLSSIVPATGYFQGYDPQVFRISKLDFWTPEFDSLGVDAIPAAALYIPQVSGLMSSGNPYSQVFGFVPRYASYKCPTCSDRLTGNFRVPSLNNGAFLNSGNSWHLMREFKAGADFNNDYANVVHTPQFISGGADFSQYKRLFYDDDADSPDNFTVIHNFEVAVFAPMKPLYDTYEFEDEGKKVTLETNGVKMN